MATIVEMINPLTGLPEQVDKLDHTAQEIDDAVDLAPQLSNPNLLDNWYFGNPVNQRGQTSYTDVGYGIDRWFMYSGALKIQNGIIELSASSSGGTFEQKIENPKRFAGKTVTLSVLGKRSKASWYITVRQDGVYRNISLSITNSFACASVTFVADSTLSNELAIAFACWDESDVAEIKAAKLELGSQQTLAHQDADGNWVLNEIPDYGEQLARCQRYFQTFATESLRPTNALDFRPVMRATPALSTITVGGKTLYTASADL